MKAKMKFENEKQMADDVRKLEITKSGFSVTTAHIYDRNFRRRALLKHFLNDRKVRNVLIAGFSTAVVILGIITVLLIPLIRKVGDYISESGFF